MGWIVMLPALALLRVINKRVNPKGKSKKAVAVVTMLVAAVAGCGLAYTVLGTWVAGLVSWFAAWLSRIFDADLGLAVPVALTILAAGIAVADIAYDKKADRGAQWMAILAPTLLYLAVGGTMGATGGDVVTTVNTTVASFMTGMGG